MDRAEIQQALGADLGEGFVVLRLKATPKGEKTAPNFSRRLHASFPQGRRTVPRAFGEPDRRTRVDHREGRKGAAQFLGSSERQRSRLERNRNPDQAAAGLPKKLRQTTLRAPVGKPGR